MDAKLAFPKDNRAWMLQFLAWNIPITFLYSLVILAAFALTGHLTFLISGVLTLVYGCLLIWSRKLTQASNLGLAAGLVSGGLAVMTVGSVIHAPSLWPMAVLLNLLAVVIVLPYLRPALLRLYFVGTWALCMLLVAMGEWVRLIPEHVPFLPVIQLLTVGSVLGFVLFLLWQYHARLLLLLEQVREANSTLQATQAGLEAEVAARTSALRDERDFAVSVMNTVGQGLLVTDESGRYTFVNPAAAAMLGYEPAQIVGRLPYEFTLPEEREQLTSSLKQRREGVTSSYELRMRHADGSTVYGLVTGTPWLRDGKFAGTIVAVTDLTERKRIEAALAYARDEAITASRLKSEFLANMSHELRTPLNAVLGAADLLTLTEPTDEQRRFIAMIHSSGKSLLRLIGDLLDFSRMESGKLELERRPFDPQACVREAVDAVAPLAEKKGLALQVQIEETVPPALVGDEVRIGQVLNNLLGNAVKFTAEGSIVVSLSYEPEAIGGSHKLLCVVRDTGIGIPPERLGAIFEPFIQVDASTTRRYGGTGLGLAVCRRLVALMGGTIWVESEVGRGSTFSFTCVCEPATPTSVHPDG